MSYIDLLSWIKIIFMKNFSFLIKNLFVVRIILLILKFCLKIRFILKTLYFYLLKILLEKTEFYWFYKVLHINAQISSYCNLIVALKF
jgi:hypothetical protein